MGLQCENLICGDSLDNTPPHAAPCRQGPLVVRAPNDNERACAGAVHARAPNNEVLIKKGVLGAIACVLVVESGA